mgnify:CR=1 FL=1
MGRSNEAEPSRFGSADIKYGSSSVAKDPEGAGAFLEVIIFRTSVLKRIDKTTKEYLFLR